MTRTQYTIDIEAPKEKVWHTMLDPETYKQWTSAFHAGSYYEGSWDTGSRIRFVSADDGGRSGILGQIVENIPYEFLSIETVAMINDGQEDTTSEEAKKWVGSHEDYHFSEHDGVTTLVVELSGESSEAEMKDMFDGMWPEGLQKLKEITEGS